jgi:hypothetical protein
MNGLSQQLFAGAVLTEQQHADVNRGNSADIAKHGGHRGAAVDDALES